MGPRFGIDADSALEPVRLSWAPILPNGSTLDVTASWHQACAAVTDAITAGSYEVAPRVAPSS